jgi:hypothetical protein
MLAAGEPEIAAAEVSDQVVVSRKIGWNAIYAAIARAIENRGSAHGLDRRQDLARPRPSRSAG